MSKAVFSSGPLRGRGYFGCQTILNLVIWSTLVALIVAASGLLGQGIHYRDTTDCYPNEQWCIRNATDHVCRKETYCSKIAVNGSCTTTSVRFCDASPSRTNHLNPLIKAGIAMMVLVAPTFLLFFISKPPIDYDAWEKEEDKYVALAEPIKAGPPEVLVSSQIYGSNQV